MTKENKIETDFIDKLKDLKYKYRPDIRFNIEYFRESFNINIV